jgi:filamentous hemagglutinin family protein
MLKTGHRTKYHLRAFEFLAARRRSRAVLTCTLLTSFLITMPISGLQAGDILRGGASGGNAKRNSETRANAGAAAAQAAKVRAQDRLARTTKAVNDMRALQASARAAAGANAIPNGITQGGLQPQLKPGIDIKPSYTKDDLEKWEGANAPTASGNNVNIKQTAAQALLHWETFNVGSQTTVNFDQSAGGVDVTKWIAFNKVFDPTAKPSQIRGKINAQGQVYIINQNGIIFGAGSQVNARALVASALPINDNLVKNGLLNNKDAQFLFSALEVPGGLDGTPTFTPSDVPDVSGDVLVERGAKISSPELAGGNGGRVMLIGANVRNEGEIYTPAGQTILAAGLQVGVQAHTSGDPSLRGLDVWVGSVGDYAGAVTNSGLVESRTGSIFFIGKQINQSGILESSTSVNLNGRIDLIASYGAVANPNFDNISQPGGGGPMFLNQFTGNIYFGEISTTRIVPEYDSLKSVPSIRLPQNSQVNIEASNVQFDPGSTLFAPSGDVAIRAGVWSYKDDESDNHTIFLEDGATAESGLNELNLIGGSQRFVFTEGSVRFSSGSVLDVAGTPDVFVSADQYLQKIQLRGTELADSPIQRSQSIRGKTLTVDLRRSGTYGGRFWIGTPLGDATGFANIIQRNAAQLTTRGGTVKVAAGSQVNVESDSEINVSGGYTRNEGGLANTTRLLRNGRPIDISAATPDVVYDGILEESFTEASMKWGVNEDYKKILLPLARYNERSYIEGASGGSVKFTAPVLNLSGKILGSTVTGPKQLSTPPALSSLSLTFRNQKQVIDLSGAPNYIDSIQAAPAIVLSRNNAATSLTIADRPTAGPLLITPDLFTEKGGGFGFLNIDNTDGTILVPKNTPLELPAGGSLTLTATNVEILSPVTIPGGSLSVKAYNISPFSYAEQGLLDDQFGLKPAPAVIEGCGIISVGSSAGLNVSGTNFDERYSSSIPSNSRRMLDGGSITLESYSILMDPTSSAESSGGIGLNARGKISKGNGGSISILAGKDPNLATSAGGDLQLPKKLQAFSALTGGSLRIQAPEIMLTGKQGDAPVLSQGSHLALSPTFFQRGGFTDYTLVATGLPDSTHASIDISPGTIIKPVAEKLVPTRPNSQPFQLGVEPLMLTVGSRSPASLNLVAKGYDDSFTEEKLESVGSITLGKGAVIQTDPLAKVSLRGQIVSIFGTIDAPSGKITVQGDSTFPLPQLEAASSINALVTLHLAPSARLLSKGFTILTPDRFGRRIGQVLDGGSITLKGNIAAEEGAILDVSGISDQLDIHPTLLGTAYTPGTTSGLSSRPWGQQSIRTQVDSNGGAISLQGAKFLYSDATLRGFSGGYSAAGGLLSVSSGAFSTPTVADTTLIVTHSGRALSPNNRTIRAGSSILDTDGNVIAGNGFFAATSFVQGGFDSLDLGYQNTTQPQNLQFIGPVYISAPGSIRLASGGVITADNSVEINASRIAIGQEFTPPQRPGDILTPFPNMPQGEDGKPEPVKPTFGSGSLVIKAKLIDFGTTVLKNIGELSITAENGDIRGSGFLNVAGSVTLTAAQIYPVSLSRFEIFAYGDGSSVQINQSGTRSLPLSAGGQLAIYSQNIINAGTLRAPFGSITLGWDGSDKNPATEDIDPPENLVAGAEDFPATQNLVLQPGSTTSVSAVDPLTGKEIVVPYGIVPDGNSWIDPRGINITTNGMPQKNINLRADSITQKGGSLIDLRGGGDLLAYRWVSGPGGSADILGSPVSFAPSSSYPAAALVAYNGKTYSSRLALDPGDFNGSLPKPEKSAYWLEIPESYAILPDFRSEFAPHNPFVGSDPGYISSTLKLGDRIVLDGNSALPVGSYTLLPRRYGVMPGAYLITPISNSVTSYTNAEGATFASAYRINSFSPTAASPSLRSNFEILTPAVLAGRAEYETYRANTFIPQAAAALRTVVNQPLPRDSAALAIQGNNALTLQGNVLARSLGGLGANIDISSQSAITIGSSSTIADGIVLDATRLSSWGAASLLIGGLRRSTTGGTVVDVNSDSITFSGSLSGSDLILASKTSLTLQGGSSLSSTGLPATASPKISIAGQGALVRVSSDANAAFARTSTEGDNEPSLIVEDGATISGAGVILDSTKTSSMSPSASLTVRSLSLGSQKIAVDFEGSSLDPSALTLGGEVLRRLSSAERLLLNSYSSIDFNGSGTLGSDSLKTLSFLAGGLQGLGGDVTLRATSVSFANPLGSTFEATATSGSLQILGQTLGLGSGVFELGGFDSSIITASAGVRASGTGKLKSNGAITIEASAVAASRLANYEISAASELELNKSDSTASVSSELGATLSLIGSSVAVNSDISLPSGLLKIQATTGDVTIGSELSVDGSALTFYDTTRFADAGSIVVQADAGNILLDSAGVLSTQGAANGGRAGLLQISSTEGEFQNAGTLLGKAATGFQGGSFQLDANALSDFASINDPLEDGGFDTSRIFRVRTGDVLLDQAIKSHTFELAADGGDITVSNTIDASGQTGGLIALSASGSLTLLEGASLTVFAEKFNSAGKGGEIFIAAGSQRNGEVDSEATLNLSAGELNLSVSGESYKPGNYDEVGSSAFEGKFQGVLHLRAPRTDSTIQISSIDSTITGASAIVAEGYKLYDITDSDGVMNIALRDRIHEEAGGFMTNENDITSTLFNSIPENFVLAPGVEIINRTGDLTLGLANNLPGGTDDPEGTSAADWDLSSWRCGAKQVPGFLTLRAKGDIVFNNTLSDGFDPVQPVDSDPGSNYTNGLSYEENGHSKLWLAQLQKINDKIPTNLQSWSFTISAGADMAGASAGSLLPLSTLDIDTESNTVKGSVLVGEFYPSQPNPYDGSTYNDDFDLVPAGVGGDGTTANNLRINLTQKDDVTTYKPALQFDLDGNPIVDSDQNRDPIILVNEYGDPVAAYKLRKAGNAIVNQEGNLLQLLLDEGGNLLLDSEGNPTVAVMIDEGGTPVVDHQATNLLRDKGSRYEVVRTGTGDIQIHAAQDVQLRNSFATIYTAGVANSESEKVFSEGDFIVPVVNPSTHPDQGNLGGASQNFIPQWAMAGGNLKITAGNDIARVTQVTLFTDSEQITKTIFDSSHQITSNWLYRRNHVDPATGKFGSIDFEDVSDKSASTTWWVDYSNFFQGFGALGGGNVELTAGRDVINADAVAPTNARMAGIVGNENLAPSLANLLQYGGGDVSVRASRNIEGGIYYVERGQGLLKAGAAIKSNASKSPSIGLLNRDLLDTEDTRDPEFFSESTWLPTTLFVGKGDFEVSAKNDVLLGPVLNPFLMPVGSGNKFWYKTYFSTYAPDSSVNVTSLGGSVTFRTSVVLPTANPVVENLFSNWIYYQNFYNTDKISYLTHGSFFQPWTRLIESDMSTFSSVLNLMPATLKATAFSGDLNVVGNILLTPSRKGNLELIAGEALNGLQKTGETTEFASIWASSTSQHAEAWSYSTINLSDANPDLIPGVLSPLSYYAFAAADALNATDTTLMNYLDEALTESGSFKGGDASIDLKIKRHGSTLLHADDENPTKIYAAGGDFSGFTIFSPKETRLISEGDISDVSLYLQTLNPSHVSIVAAAGDILPYNASSKLRSIASNLELGNKVLSSESYNFADALTGDIQASGPGILEVLAGRNIDLGTGASQPNGTGLGITSIGNARNPNLPFNGASLVALAGVSGKETGAALGLAKSQLALNGLKDLDASIAPIVPEFSTPEHEALAGLKTLFALLQVTGKNYPETGRYEPGLGAVQQAFASLSGQGDILTRVRDIRTVSGGSIYLAAPQGGLTMASDIFGNPLTPPGIVTEYGGSVSLLTDGSVDIGRCRIFTLRGGDMTIWSTTGDIAAGTSPKTVVTAPPTRVLIDTPSADVATDLGGLATGGGIGVLASVEGVAPGDVYLLAPSGSVDAGDAGIKSTGNLNIAAVSVINADNIAASGVSVGVPSAAPAAAAPVSVSPGASSSTAATSSAAQTVSQQSQEKKEVEETPSMISVEVLGYGGGEGDGGKEEEDEQASQQSAML